MPATIKIYPPSQLPEKGVNETQFNIWTEELEVYLSQDDDFSVFLPGAKYSTWTSFETNPNRIVEIKQGDRVQRPPGANAAALEAAAERDGQTLTKVQKNLRTVLSIIGKCVTEGHYSSVVRHSNSIQWIYDTLRSDYDIRKKGIHFFNILEAKFNAEITPVSFYNQYRTIVTNNLGKNGDIVKYKNDLALTEDEKMTPMLEDMILLNVIREIDPRLPALVKTHYNHKMKPEDRLMDFKTDILVNIPSFIEQLDSSEQNNSIKDDLANLHAFKQTRNKPRMKPKTAQPFYRTNLYCRLCHKCNLPRDVYTSHNFADEKCTQVSKQDREKLMNGLKLSNIQGEEDSCKDEEEIAEMFGYQEEQPQEVKETYNDCSSYQFSRMETAKCSYIKPVPSQILTMYQDSANKIPIHIDLDSGATVNYIKESEVIKYQFKVYPNGQLSKLGDGVTKLKGIGEIHESFFRNNWKVKFSAVICKQLTSPLIGGTVFLKDNKIDQDFVRDVIHINNKAVTVQPTDPISLLPVAPIITSTPKVISKIPPNLLLSFKSRVLLPGQLEVLDVKHKEGETVAVESMEHNNNSEWPRPHLQNVSNGKIILKNESNDPIFLGKDVKQFRIRRTQETSIRPNYSYGPKLSNISENDNTDLISIGEMPTNVKEIINEAHTKFNSVFNKDLSQGYNHAFGKHECHLNWATSERPLANKVRVPSYDHNLKGVQQDLMDDLTDQGVLMIPQEHDIVVQSVCPSFIQRKQKAKDKPNHLLTKSDVRLLINFGPINDKIKPVPCHVSKTDDILIMIGRWKFIIQLDLHNGYFQNHMAKDAIPWLGVQTPFGGLRVMSRSGQGLAGMAEEFDELTAKILKDEIKEAKCAKIVDDLYVGGETKLEAAENYAQVLSKLAKANLKVTPEKTNIFPTSADILGWVWKEGGRLEASKHRKLALSNTKIEDIKTVNDMRSWVGLFKTLHILTPDISEVLSPFEQATGGGKQSREKFDWTHELESKFRAAKEHIDKLVTLYLPSPRDQLLLETDASKGGVGHILYAIKEGKKLPVRIHSTKLPDKCKKWSPCENEALALAVGVNKEYDIIRESSHPLQVRPDNKTVHEAIKLINGGKFSTSSRISSFLTNINRTPIESRHISGKAKLNPFSDIQSRLTPECTESCSVHKFINESIESIVDESAKNGKIELSSAGFSNRSSWLSSQKSNQACSTAKQHLASGKPPPKAMGKNTGEYWNDVRQYCRDATLAKDELLVVKSEPDMMSGNLNRERIVVPKPLVPALLYHLHNHNDQHPVKSQQKANFQRQFYAVHLDKHLELLYQNCYKCSVIQKLPKEIIVNETKTDVTGPHTHFHADVIKRASQNILTVKDHFSSYQDAIIIQSEKAHDLKEGLIMLTSSMRKPGKIKVSVDNSPGFKSLLNSNDAELDKLQIEMVKTDEINKNSNAVIDKGCQELEDELKRLEPEGTKITSATLKLATLNLNKKLRRRGNISAYEINSSRDQNTGENMDLNDKSFRDDQLKKRKDNAEPKTKDVYVGDTVTIANRTDKHKAKEMFLVTGKEADNISVQKVLHPLTKTPTKLMSKVYNTKQKHLHIIHRPETPAVSDLDEAVNDDESEQTATKQVTRWNPINQRFYQADSDDEEEDSKLNSNDSNNTQTEEPNINEELQWDDSPEQIALGQTPIQTNSSNDDNFLIDLQPRQLFEGSGEETDLTSDDDEIFEETDLTSETDDEEVFIREQVHTPDATPRLQRRNAFRKKQSNPHSEPRVTRRMLNPGERQISISNPSSPTEVVLHRPQILDRVLLPRVPLVPEVVNLDDVQVLHHALEPAQSPIRRSSRIESKPKVDYQKLHTEGKGE